MEVNSFGILVYADDIVLLSASCPGLQAMITECEKFANQRNMKFSTNEDPKKCKTKCIVFSKKASERKDIVPMILNNLPLNWVPTIKHLGSILQENNSMEIDCDKKRFSFIGKIHSLSQEFFFIEPSVRMKLHQIYTESFYGSSLWNLFGNNCDRIYKAYNISVRQTFQIPRDTHRYLIETISQCIHPKVFLCSRLVKFVDTMNNCHKISIRILSKLYESDLRNILGKNLSSISQLCDVPQEILSPYLVKSSMKYFPTPEFEEWRGEVIHELLEARKNSMDIRGFDNNEISEMLQYLCSN